MSLAFSTMPTINVDSIELTADEKTLVARILNKGKLRASKPKIAYTIVDKPRGNITIKIRQPDDIGGKAAYVWRMVAFIVSPISQHHCMPCTAEFDLPEDNYTLRRELAKELDKLVDKIVASVPKEQWYGVKRWRGLVS